MNGKQEMVKKILLIVGICIGVFIVVSALAFGTYNFFKHNKEKENQTAGQNKEKDELSSAEVDEGVALDHPTLMEGLDEENLEETEEETKEEEKKEEEKNLTEEEKKKQEEAKKKQEEERKKKQEEAQKAQAQNYPYWIKVNRSANTVTIYKKDADGNFTVPVKAMVCSTGAQTPRSGVYRTGAKYQWGTLIGPVYGQYCTRIVGGILFHSVPYLKSKDKSSLEYWEYDRLGQTRSMGCIRLTVADAQWIFYNCPSGTSVEFYSSSNPGPLGKPGITKVSAAGETLRGWDPTDPDPNNPWRRRAEEEAAAKKKAEEEAAAKKKAEEEAAAKKKAEEEAAAKKKAEEEAARKKAEEQAAEANKIVVPNVVGKTEAEAKNLLKDFKITVEYNENASKDNGLVSYQSLTSGSKVAKGTGIKIKVNKVKNTSNTTNNTTNSTNNTTSSNTTNGTNVTNAVNSTTTNTTNTANTTI